MATANNYYGTDTTQSNQEAAAGVKAQPFYSMLNPDGSLNKNYQVDPSQSSAFNQEAQYAQSADLSPWAQLQMQQNKNTTMNQKDQGAAQAMGANDQAMQQLMTTGGGTNSGTAAILGMNNQRNQVMNNQNINNQSQQNALGIQATDAQNKQTALGQVANTETAAQAANAGAAQQDTTYANTYAATRYNTQMQAYGAQQTANAQVVAANNSGGKK
jgi:hypothetical protein